jgi:hypothetical protein
LVASKFDQKICMKDRKFISSGFRVDRWGFKKILTTPDQVTPLKSYDGLKKCITLSGAPCIVGCLGSVRSNCNSKKSIIWFIMISPKKFQPPNPSIKASNAFRDFGVLAVLYENRKSCLTFLFSKNFSLFCFGFHSLGI